MRLDLLLVQLRFAKSRSIAQKWIGEGHFRLNGSRITKPDAAISPGAVLTMPMRSFVQVIEILHLPLRRGPASEAQACYLVLDAGQPIGLAQTERAEAGTQIRGSSPP